MPALTEIPLEERAFDGLWRRAVAAAPDRPFLRWADGVRSYAAFDAEAGSVAAGLATLGVGRGDRVALMLRNSLEFLQAWFACVKLGAVYVPINTDYKGAILRHQLDRAEVSHIVTEAGFVERLAAIEEGLGHLRHIVVVDRWGGPDGETPQGIAITPFAHLAQAPARDIEGVSDYRDPLAISFTSGTTGPSKGVLASHCHVLSFALDWIEACGFRADDRLYSPLPMFHAIATWPGRGSRA